MLLLFIAVMIHSITNRKATDSEVDGDQRPYCRLYIHAFKAG